jgi:hypothetical protein
MPTGSWRHPPLRRFIRSLPANPHRAAGLLHLSAPASVQAPAYLARQQEPSFANASAQQRLGQRRLHPGSLLLVRDDPSGRPSSPTGGPPTPPRRCSLIVGNSTSAPAVSVILGPDRRPRSPKVLRVSLLRFEDQVGPLRESASAWS